MIAKFGLTEMEISILLSILTWISWENLKSLSQSNSSQIERFLKPRIPIYKSKVPDKAGRRTQTISRRYAFQANSKRPS